MAFKSNTSISCPPDSGRIHSRVDMGGYGWHPDHGLFIPVSEPLDYIPEPYPSGIQKEDPAPADKSPIKTSDQRSVPLPAQYPPPIIGRGSVPSS